MRTRSALIAGVALGALAALSPTLASARVGKHHHRVARAGPSATEVEQEIAALHAQVQSLESRLDAQAQAQAQTQAQAQAAQTQAQTAQTAAQAAQTQAQTAQSQIETIPAQVATEVAKEAPKPGWWNNTTVGGTIFSDLSYISNENDGVKNSQSGLGFDIKRMYIQVDHAFNDMFSAQLTTDFTYDSVDKATQLYIKRAFLQAKVSDAFIVRFGGADMAWIPFVEDIYGYRYVDHALVDNYGYGTTADWGVHVLGSLFDHHVGYQLSVVDGQGYKIPATGTANRSDSMDVEGRVNVTYDHFTVAVGGYEGKLGEDVVGGPPTFNTAGRFDALAAYKNERFTIGVEYMYAKYWHDVLQSDPTKTNSSDALSAFASVNFTRQLALFGRYDWVKPQDTTAPSFTSNYFNVGVSYKPIDMLDIALVYKRDSVTDGLLATSNGTIGALASPANGKGTYDEIGLFTRVKF